MNEKAKFNETNNDQKERIEILRQSFSGMYDIINKYCKSSRETSLAITKLEEAQFWTIKSISREDTNHE